MSKNLNIVVACHVIWIEVQVMIEALGLAFHQSPTFINAYCQTDTYMVDRG